jgi:GT2 family glycosyltransferase/glycosyltransferase involved in cell wall biosynthesis
MQVSVIVPVYNALPFAKECVASIFAAGSRLTFEVIVVDNGSAPDVQEWLLSEERPHSNLRHVSFPEPLGFSRAVNAGAAAATGDVLVILNSDTIVTPGWMEGLYLALSADPTLGAITPTTNHAGTTAQMDFRTIDLSQSKALALVQAKPNPPRIRYFAQRISFFCVAIRGALWQELGGLDESYRVGNFEDDHLCMRLRVAGFRLGVAEHIFVYHHNNATFHANAIGHQTWMTQNAPIFAEHARQFAEASGPPAPPRPKSSATDISVVILPKTGVPLDRTLLSLRNQTLCDFEILLPDSSGNPRGTWIAYVTAGDILYPFHLETLRDELQRSGSQAIFSDGWLRGGTHTIPHPDAQRGNASSALAPRMLAGWMHHHSLDPKRLWERTAPLHWAHLTWEMLEAPPPMAGTAVDRNTAGSFKLVIESARNFYRRCIPYETRLSIDEGLRKILRLGTALPRTSSSSSQSVREIADRLAAAVASRTDAGKFSTDSVLPDVVLFSIVPWHALTQRPHHFARGLAARGHRVFWIETRLRSDPNWWTGRPFEQVSPGVHLVHLPGQVESSGRCDIYAATWDPLILEAMSSALAQLAAAYGVRQAVSLVNFPRWEPVVMRARNQLGWNIVYDCLDDQRAFADLYTTPLRNHETQLIAKADGLITSSVVLQRRMFGQRPSILLHNGADYELFSSCASAGYLRHLAQPIIGFFGAFADWLDIDLIREAASRFPQWSFVYIGAPSFSRPEVEARWLDCTSAANIVVLPQMDPRTLAVFLADFDVCTMPFLDVPVTQTMNAVKIYEYLAAGKPVVSRDLPEVRHLVDAQRESNHLIGLYRTREEFFERLREAAASDDPSLIRRRQEFAQAHDWSNRVDVLVREIMRVSLGGK